MMEAADSVYQQQAAATGAWVEDTAAQYWQQRDSRERATGSLGELGAPGCAVPPAGDYTPAELPRRYAFLYGDKDVYRAVLHQCVASTDAVDSTGGRKRGFASWPATFEGVAGHVFALTTAQFALLDQLFPSCVARNSVLANISQGSDVSDGAQSSTGVSEGASRARRQTLACSTWIKAPLVEGGSNTASVAHRTGVDGPAPGSKRSLLVTSIGSVTDLDLEEQPPTDPPATGSYAQPATVAPPSLRGSFGSDVRLSFGSDWRTSLPDLDLLPDMLDHTMPIPAVAAATATASLAAAAMPSTTAGRCSKSPRRPRSHPTKMKRTQECDDRPAAALAASAGYEAQVRTVGLLPRGPDGRPKPSPPWIAAIVYWASSSDHALLTRATGISVTKPARFGADTNADAPAAAAPMPGTAAEFRIITLGHATKQAFGREATIDSGVALSRFVREVMKLAGSNVRVPGWDSTRKHLSPVWWTNPTRGGNRSGDFSQTYVERVPGSFAAQCAELRRLHPAVMQAALSAWEEWYRVAAEEKRAAVVAEPRPTEGGGNDAPTSRPESTAAVD